MKFTEMEKKQNNSKCNYSVCRHVCQTHLFFDHCDYLKKKERVNHWDTLQPTVIQQGSYSGNSKKRGRGGAKGLRGCGRGEKSIVYAHMKCLVNISLQQRVFRYFFFKKVQIFVTTTNTTSPPPPQSPSNLAPSHPPPPRLYSPPPPLSLPSAHPIKVISDR